MKDSNYYLFKIKLWREDPPEFILIKARYEDDARRKAASELLYNNGDQVKPEDLQLVTYEYTY